MDDQAQAVVDDLPELPDTEPSQVDIEDTEEEATEAETQEVEEEEAPQEPSFVEVEINGVTYEVPEELKDGFMMQSDYTRKTQELAKTRKEFEEQQNEVKTKREQLEQATKAVQQNLQQYAVLSHLDSQLQEYANVDWDALNQQDTDLARQHQFNYMQLRDQRNQVYQGIQERERQALQQQQYTFAKQLEESRSVLSREIEGFSPELESRLKEHAVSIGARKDIAEHIIADPVATKILYKSYLYDQLQDKAKTARKVKAEIKPIKKVKGSSPGKKSVYDDNLTPAQRIAMFQKGNKR